MFEKDKKQEERLKNNPVSNDNDLHIKDEVYDNKRHEEDHETQIEKAEKTDDIMPSTEEDSEMLDPLQQENLYPSHKREDEDPLEEEIGEIESIDGLDAPDYEEIGETIDPEFDIEIGDTHDKPEIDILDHPIDEGARDEIVQEDEFDREFPEDADYDDIENFRLDEERYEGLVCLLK
ncbi:MAG TPA: hypothetical protein VIG45_05575 [Erysipelothrix sp.]